MPQTFSGIVQGLDGTPVAALVFMKGSPTDSDQVGSSATEETGRFGCGGIFSSKGFAALTFGSGFSGSVSKNIPDDVFEG